MTETRVSREEAIQIIRARFPRLKAGVFRVGDAGECAHLVR